MATGDKLVTLDGLKSVYDTTSDMIALDYADLTFPIKKGDFCKNGGILYRSVVDIPSTESWTAAHWETAPLGNALAGDITDLKSALEYAGIPEAFWINGNWTRGRIGVTNGAIVTNATTDIASSRFIAIDNAKQFNIYIPEIPEGADYVQVDIAQYSEARVGNYLGTLLTIRSNSEQRNIAFDENTKYIRIAIRAHPYATITLPDDFFRYIYFVYDNSTITSVAAEVLEEAELNTKNLINVAEDRYTPIWVQGKVNEAGVVDASANYSIYCEIQIADQVPGGSIYMANHGEITPSQALAVFKDSDGEVLGTASKLDKVPEAVPENTAQILIGFRVPTTQTLLPDYGNNNVDIFGTKSETVFNLSKIINSTLLTTSSMKTVIPNGTDYDTLITAGNYMMEVTGDASSMVHCPTQAKNCVFVFGTTNENTIYQVVCDYNGDIFYRVKLNATSGFKDFVKIQTEKPLVFSITPTWAMQGFYLWHGSFGYNASINNWVSEPVKLYADDEVTFQGYFQNNTIAIMKYFDRWNTFKASRFGALQSVVTTTKLGAQTLTATIPETGYYVFSARPSDALISVKRSAAGNLAKELHEKLSAWSYGQEKHNYVDELDYVPDMVTRRAVSTMIYSADNKKSENYIANAVAYPNGEILACRAGGKVVLIRNDGTEVELKIERDGVMTTVAPNAQDWRCVFMDSNLNVYVSPHQTLTGSSMSSVYRGLYKIEYGTFEVTKVIELCRSDTDILLWKKSQTRSYDEDDIIFLDNNQNQAMEFSLKLFRCNTAYTHNSNNAFESEYWTEITDQWQTGVTYSVGDIVLYHSCYFWCNTAHTAGSSFSVRYWDAATEHMDNNDTIWTMCEDEQGNLYAGVYAHSTRENAAIYRKSITSNYWFYQYNFVWNKTLTLEEYGVDSIRHVHCINFNPYDNTLYAAVGEVNTLVKSTDHGAHWVNMRTPCYYGQPTYVMGVRDGLVIGSDGHYSCGISKLMTDGKTMKKCGRTAPGFIFNIRRSDLTGWLYAWTRIDNVVQYRSQCPPIEAINDPAVLEAWKNSPDTNGEYLQYWTKYNEWASIYYPEDAIRPQNSVIMVSRDEGDTWEVIHKVKCATNYASFTGFTTVGYFRDGECLSGLELPVEGTEDNFAYVQPVVISEGKKKRVMDGFDLTGEIFIKTNSSAVVAY